MNGYGSCSYLLKSGLVIVTILILFFFHHKKCPIFLHKQVKPARRIMLLLVRNSRHIVVTSIYRLTFRMMVLIMVCPSTLCWIHYLRRRKNHKTRRPFPIFGRNNNFSLDEISVFYTGGILLNAV